ncbi:MAG: hypothetical protein ACK5TO_04570 [Planctomycetaceae bacterium]
MSQAPESNCPFASLACRLASDRCRNSGLLNCSGADSGSEPAATFVGSGVKSQNSAANKGLAEKPHMAMDINRRFIGKYFLDGKHTMRFQIGRQPRQRWPTNMEA